MGILNLACRCRPIMNAPFASLILSVSPFLAACACGPGQDQDPETNDCLSSHDASVALRPGPYTTGAVHTRQLPDGGSARRIVLTKLGPAACESVVFRPSGDEFLVVESQVWDGGVLPPQCLSIVANGPLSRTDGWKYEFCDVPPNATGGQCYPTVALSMNLAEVDGGLLVRYALGRLAEGIEGEVLAKPCP